MEHRDRQTAEFGEPQELMFTSRNGQPLFSSNFRRRELKPLLRELGMDERIHLYALRHTHITLLLAAGASPSRPKKKVDTLLTHTGLISGPRTQ